MPMTDTRQGLHRLVDRLPAGELPAAKRMLEQLAAAGDPVLRALMEAPEDDEPEAPEEAAAGAEAYEDIARGEIFTDDELRRELEL